MAAQVDSAPRTGAPHLRADSSRREIGEEAVWSLSTAKVPLGAPKAPLRAFFLQVCVASMHQNGRDTHVRQCRVFAPRARIDVCLGEFGEDFASNKLSRYAVLR